MGGREIHPYEGAECCHHKREIHIMGEQVTAIMREQATAIMGEQTTAIMGEQVAITMGGQHHGQLLP
jgi:hypothetical protein